jgi:hypothetical protein
MLNPKLWWGIVRRSRGDTDRKEKEYMYVYTEREQKRQRCRYGFRIGCSLVELLPTASSASAMARSRKDEEEDEAERRRRRRRRRRRKTKEEEEEGFLKFAKVASCLRTTLLLLHLLLLSILPFNDFFSVFTRASEQRKWSWFRISHGPTKNGNATFGSSDLLPESIEVLSFPLLIAAPI